jgi:Domain of unknown function (DUF4157)
MENKIIQNKDQSTTASANHFSSQNKSSFSIKDNRPHTILQQKQVEGLQQLPIQKKANNTGLPNQLKSGIENLSGHSMDDVKVHYNSNKPAQLNAHAYAQGTEIHVASGQEKHLAHEAWHVVQQKQGRVKPTMQLKGKVNVNDDKGLEKEADVMGAKALQMKGKTNTNLQSNTLNKDATVQGMFKEDGLEFSQNAKYAIPLADNKVLFASIDVAPPLPVQHFKKVGEIEKKIIPPVAPKEEKGMESEAPKIAPLVIKFDVYASNKEFNHPQHEEQPNDCGMYANALAHDKKTWGKEIIAGEHLAGMIPPKDDSCQYSPSDEAQKDNLSLDVGDMYRMDWDKPHLKPVEKSGHHVATVVAKDGVDHITSEADAGEKLPTAIFRMYGTVDKTFWQTHHEYFREVNQGAPFVSKYQHPKNAK